MATFTLFRNTFFAIISKITNSVKTFIEKTIIEKEVSTQNSLK